MANSIIQVNKQLREESNGANRRDRAEPKASMLEGRMSRVRKIDDDAGVLARARHGTTTKWSSPTSAQMEELRWGWAR